MTRLGREPDTVNISLIKKISLTRPLGFKKKFLSQLFLVHNKNLHMMMNTNQMFEKINHLCIKNNH